MVILLQEKLTVKRALMEILSRLVDNR